MVFAAILSLQRPSGKGATPAAEGFGWLRLARRQECGCFRRDLGPPQRRNMAFKRPSRAVARPGPTNALPARHSTEFIDSRTWSDRTFSAARSKRTG